MNNWNVVKGWISTLRFRFVYKKGGNSCSSAHIDLVTANALSLYLAPYILQEVEYIEA